MSRTEADAQPDPADNSMPTPIDGDSLKLVVADVARLSAIVESSDDAIIGKDLRGNITSWNLGAEKLYGYKAAEVIGKHVSVIIPPGRRDEYELALDQIRAGKHVEAIDTVRRHKNGTNIEVSLRFSPIHDAAGEMVGASAIARDITELQQARRSLQRALKRRDRFLASLSHELRNPLNAVQNATQILNRPDADPETRQDALRIVTRQSHQMARLLDDLLDVSRITEGKIRIRRKVIDLRSTANDAVLSLRSQLEIREQRVDVELPDEPLCVFADPVRMQQIQVNLLTNASKYSPRGEAIELRLTREDGLAVVSVRDNGMGLTDDLRKRIFEPFVQSQEALEQADGGMGIGLTLVRALVHVHDGTITVHSDGRGQGCEFTVRLPLRRPNVRADNTPFFLPEASDRPLRIVIVEDEADNRSMLQALLQLDGHEVFTAGTGLKGVEQIRLQRPDVALVDLGLPDIDGCEVARRVRTNPAGASVRLVALTGYGRRQDLERTRTAGFNAHVTKPMDPEKLARALSPPSAATDSDSADVPPFSSRPSSGA